jgi:hypothetical protein
MAHALQFSTKEAYVSGGICGDLWWPQVLGGKTFRANLRGLMNEWDRHDCDTFAECLESLLMENDGDFQGGKFTADTEIVIIRKAFDGGGRYRVHVRRYLVADLPGCKDIVNTDAYTGDFLGEDE